MDSRLRGKDGSGKRKNSRKAIWIPAYEGKTVQENEKIAEKQYGFPPTRERQFKKTKKSRS